MPKITVIVPVYRAEKYLSDCVGSILSQSVSDFQLILVDDGSPDNCGKLCDDYAAQDHRVISCLLYTSYVALFQREQQH